MAEIPAVLGSSQALQPFTENNSPMGPQQRRFTRDCEGTPARFVLNHAHAQACTKSSRPGNGPIL